LDVLPSRIGSWPCPQTLDWAGKACQGQTLKLNKKIYIGPRQERLAKDKRSSLLKTLKNYRSKKLYNIGTLV
jgi:hypothetical protein